MKITRLLVVSLGLAVGAMAAASAPAEDAFYNVPFNKLTLTSGAFPTNLDQNVSFRRMMMESPRDAYAVLDGEGEIYVGGLAATVLPWNEKPKPMTETMALTARAPKGKDLTGRLFVPNADDTAMVILAFKIPGSAAGSEAKEKYLLAKQVYYERLWNRDVPGAAWFRHQEQDAIAANGGKTNTLPPDVRLVGRSRDSGDDETYNLFNGGRAVSENLQLDRALLAAKAGDATVDIASLEGITVKAMDWKPLIKDAKPETDPLAACVPADQHAIFFRSFTAMTQLMDEADGNGTPLLRIFQPRAEDRNSRGRYQKQLCLGLSEISRLLGPQAVESVAFTGSDPYLRTGTDIGVLFEAKSPEALKTFIAAKQAAAAQEDTEAKPVKGEVEGVAYAGVVSPDRSISSYLAVRSNVVFVSNSPKQLGRMLAAAAGKTPALISQDEYTFFRTRYPRGDKQETAFLVLSDATIRRWCSPQWRIAASRRTRAAAVMAEQQAAHLDELVKGTVKPGPLQTDLKPADAGELSLTKRGVSSSVYGGIDLLTPIIELPLAKVTPTEADSYKRWRDTYQQNWSRYFDPIAARFSVSSNRVGAEVTVMPLIANTEYAQFMGLSQGAAIAPGAGDPHAGAMAHFAMALNADSEMVSQGANFLGSMSPGFKANALGWLGQCVAVYADDDPFWEKLAAAEDKDTWLDKEYSKLPVALYCEVKNPLGVTAFLTALRAFADQSAPGMATWLNLDYNGQAYVKVKAKNMDAEPDQTNEMAVYYAVTPKSLLVTLNEDVLKRSLDRQAARASGKAPAAEARPWLGTNLCLQLDARFFKVIQSMMKDEGGDDAQQLSWNNLPILNEWKRRFPGQDPVKLHEQYWQTKLVCPGGGSYVWNDKWQTMESTVYGHPGEPKKGPDSFAAFVNVSSVNLGVSFENQGVSAKAVMERKP